MILPGTQILTSLQLLLRLACIPQRFDLVLRDEIFRAYSSQVPTTILTTVTISFTITYVARIPVASLRVLTSLVYLLQQLPRKYRSLSSLTLSCSLSSQISDIVAFYN